MMSFGSDSREGTAGRSFGWTYLFGSSSTGNSESSVNQPDPGSPQHGSSAAPFFPEAEPYHPLQEDEHRRQELHARLSINTIGSPLSDEVTASHLKFSR